MSPSSQPASSDGRPIVYVVDDDPVVRRMLRNALLAAELECVEFHLAEEFLAACGPDDPGCLVLDMHLPGMTGAELLAELKVRGYRLPVLFLSGFLDVPKAVRLVKDGAVEVLEKPTPNHELVRAVRQALKSDAEQRRAHRATDELQRRVSALSPRERQTLDRVASGMASKEIAAELGISSRTVEKHRENVIRKMGVESSAELIRLCAEHGLVSRAAP